MTVKYSYDYSFLIVSYGINPYDCTTLKSLQDCLSSFQYDELNFCVTLVNNGPVSFKCNSPNPPYKFIYIDKNTF